MRNVVVLVIAVFWGGLFGESVVAQPLPAVAAWAGALDGAMGSRDEGEIYVRRVLVVERGEVGVAADGDMVCETVTRNGVAALLARIASRQWIGRPLARDVVDAAARELGFALQRDAFEVCEWGEMREASSAVRYRQVYAMSLAPARLGLDVVVVIETRWVPDPVGPPGPSDESQR